MSTLIIRAAMAVMMMVGAVGGTAAAAGNSLPGDNMYGLKLAMEETRATMTNQAEAAAGLQLAFAQERLQEMNRLALMGETSGSQGPESLQNHFRLAFQFAAQTSGGEMEGLMVRTREMVQTQQQLMAGMGMEKTAQCNIQTS